MNDSPSDTAELAESAELTRISEIDLQLVHLLLQRGELTAALAKARPDVGQGPIELALDNTRLRRLSEYWLSHSRTTLSERGVQQVFREIFGVCASIGRPRRVAYLGPPGTFSHMALLQEFGTSAEQIECSTIAAVFSAVEHSDADFGVVPFENSIEGGVTFTHDCFLRSRLLICGEFVFDVRLCLVAGDSDLNQIQDVYSHPQPLAQCRNWLASHLPHAKAVACTSTAAAAQKAATNPNAAAVTSSYGAELYGLHVLAQGIEDVPGNATRFVTIATQDAPATGSDKTSLVFSTPDERGALLRVLSIFDSENLNLTRIESRPDRTRRWEYMFFTDVQGHRSEAALARALERIQAQCQMVQILGSYPKALQRADTFR